MKLKLTLAGAALVACCAPVWAGAPQPFSEELLLDWDDLRGLLRDDLFTVVHDPFLSTTARYADIVLPATTDLETEDFYRAYGTYYMQYSHRAVPPQGEAWSNLKLAQELAARMGVADAVFRMSQPEILRELFRFFRRSKNLDQCIQTEVERIDALEPDADQLLVKTICVLRTKLRRHPSAR